MDGSMSLLVKRVKYIVSKELKVPGVLTVTESQMCWAPHNPTQCQPIYADIKSIPGDLTTSLLEWMSISMQPSYTF